MKAAVLFETKGKLSVENVDISEPKKDEVLVKIKASGLCHTDWETMHGYQPVNLPAIIGHEGAGVVEAVGEGVDNVSVGDNVVCSWNPNCGIFLIQLHYQAFFLLLTQLVSYQTYQVSSFSSLLSKKEII